MQQHGPPSTSRPGLVSVVVPAHNEERSIGRLLKALTDRDNRGHDAEILVVCNGCTDKTAEIARQFGPLVRTIEVLEASKHLAMQEGDRVASGTVRVFVDGDVEIDARAIELLVAPIFAGTVMATAPERHVELARASWPVRWYYAVWSRLPQVRTGLFGRGVIAMSVAGAARVRELPRVMSDDLAMSEVFVDTERAIVPESLVTIHAPRRVGDLIKRRARVATGNFEADRFGIRRAESRTTWRTLVGIIGDEPSLLPKLVVFVAVGAAARIKSRRALRRGDFTTWLRDESSRATD